MSDQFSSFCQLCSEVYGDSGSTEGVIYYLELEDMTLEFCERDGELFCRCLVAGLEEVKDLGGCLEALLGGNYFWGGTNGATLSVKDDSVYLTDRLSMDFFGDAEMLQGYVNDVHGIVMRWRERVALYKTSSIVREEA